MDGYFIIQLILGTKHTLTSMKKKSYPSTQSNSLLFTPVSDCLDPVQDPHPVQNVCSPHPGPNCLLRLFASDGIETKYKDVSSISIRIHSNPYFVKSKKTISFAEMEIMDLLLRNKTNC